MWETLLRNRDCHIWNISTREPDYEYFALTFILHSVQRHASLHPTPSPTPISLPKMLRWHASASPWLDTREEKWGSVPNNKQW